MRVKVNIKLHGTNVMVRVTNGRAFRELGPFKDTDEAFDVGKFLLRAFHDTSVEALKEAFEEIGV